MPNEKVPDLPDHLTPLVEPTRSGVAKLLAAWDGLNTESQIVILMKLDAIGLPAYLSEKVRTKALDSTTAYVRYLAARRLYFSADDTDEKKIIKQRIEEDHDPLVRYSLLESPWAVLGRDLDDADAFFALPHEARLAKVRLLSGSGDAMANVIARAVDHQLKDGRVSAIELFELLSDYVKNPEFKKHYGPENESYDGFTEYGRGNDVDALWRLALKVPESISHILIADLPPGAGLSSGIPEAVLNGMSDRQLTTLFKRQDIELRKLRKKVFFEAGDERGELKVAAIRYNFDLDYAEFGAILALPKNEASRIIGYLFSARNLSLCLYKAIYDVSLQTEMFDTLDAEFAAKAMKRRLGEITGLERKEQLRELNLYQLAKTAVPWKKEEEGYLPSGELEFLSKEVLAGDTWGTFIAYSNVRAQNSPDSRQLEKYLIQFDEPAEDEAGELDDEDKDKHTELLDRIEEKLTEKVSSLIEQAEDKRKELTDSLRELSRDFARLQAAQDRQSLLLEQKLTETSSARTRQTEETQTELENSLSRLTADVTRLQATQDRQTMLLYVAIGLLVWLLIKIL